MSGIYRSKFIFSVPTVLMLVVVMFALTAGTVSAAETCPDGGEWTKVNSDDLSQHPVPGATQYCFKAGSWDTVSSIPAGGFGQEGPCSEHISQCDLSHWSYFIPDTTPPTGEPNPYTYCLTTNYLGLIPGVIYGVRR